MAVTDHPHRTASLHGITRMASVGAALAASVVIGFVGVNALTGNGDPNPASPVATDSSATVPPALGWPPFASPAASPPLAGAQAQGAFLDQFTADISVTADTSPDATLRTPTSMFCWLAGHVVGATGYALPPECAST